jgi:hypothetical protein
MISEIAGVIREDVTSILNESNFYSGLCDGSEARKTKEEKELVYVKVLIEGRPTYLLLKCNRMRDYGGNDAAAIKKSFLAAFEAYGVKLLEDDGKKLISVCADGASVNMGSINGAFTTLKQQINHFLIIHCSLHKLELAVQDAFKQSPEFSQIVEMMTSIYYLFKNSGKNWRMMQLIAEKMGVNILRYPKTHGTRFQSHKESGLKVFLYNMGVFLLFAENAIETRGLITPAMKAKVTGYRHKLLQYEYVACTVLYKEVLQHTSHLIFVMEKVETLITDICDELDKCVDALDDLCSSEVKLPDTKTLGGFSCQKNDEEDKVIMRVTSTSMPGTLNRRIQITEKQRENLEKKIKKQVSHEQMYELKNVKVGEKKAESVQKNLIGNIKKCIEKRFDSLKKDEVFKAMTIVDHKRWDLDNRNYGMDEIETIASYFEQILQNYFNLEIAKIEYQNLKALQTKKYCHIKENVTFWNKVYKFHQPTFSNILKIIEICLVTAWAQGTVENGFSLVRRLMPEYRSKLSNESLEELMLIKINLPILSKRLPEGEYEESVIKRSVERYLSNAKWRWSLKDEKIPKKRKAEEMDASDDSQSESEEDKTDVDNSDYSSESEADDSN